MIHEFHFAKIEDWNKCEAAGSVSKSGMCERLLKLGKHLPVKGNGMKNHITSLVYIYTCRTIGLAESFIQGQTRVFNFSIEISTQNETKYKKTQGRHIEFQIIFVLQSEKMLFRCFFSFIQTASSCTSCGL